MMLQQVSTNSSRSAHAPAAADQRSTQQDCTQPHTIKPLTWYHRWLRKKIVNRLQTLKPETNIAVQDGDGTFLIGSTENTKPAVQAIVHDPRTYHHLVWHGSLGAAESYMQGLWSTSDLVQLLCLFSRQFDTVVEMDAGSAWWSSTLSRWYARRQQNSRAGSRKNIAAHYDLSNEFFALFLDDNLMYSSALYDSPDMSLEQASRNKLNHLCRKLRLEADDHLLEIGTGWGGMALHAAQQHGCQVTTTTISKEQHQLAGQRISRAGLESRIHLLKQDYRDVTGLYDKLVSIEMIEAVGKNYIDDYFRCCQQLLKPGGRFVMQAIVIPEQRFDIYCRSVDFIQTYIFPGSFLPSIAQLQLAAGRQTSLRLVGLEDHTPSYVLTLREWRRRFEARLDEVRKLGFDERFIRMWRFYLAGCEAVFMERAAGLVQLEWLKV